MFRKLALSGLIALATLASLQTIARADWVIGFSTAEIDRYYRPGAYVPYDGVGFMQRYNYDQGGALLLGYDGRRLAHLDYLDRLERQHHFGHLWPSRKYGPVYQIQRIENEYWLNWANCCLNCCPW